MEIEILGYSKRVWNIMKEVTPTAIIAIGDLFEKVRSEAYPSRKAPHRDPISIIEAMFAIYYPS